MTTAEASAIEYEEPDWWALFDQECARFPNLPRYLQEDEAFPEVMRQWRRWHWTPVDVDGQAKKMPAGAVEAMIALAKIKIMPPRSTRNDIPHSSVAEGYQHDDHMWLSIAGEQWRIAAVESRMLCLEKMTFDGSVETRQIDLSKAKWDGYIIAATAVLDAMRE